MEIDLNELERLANAATPGPWFMYDSELWVNNGSGAFEIRDSQNPGVAKTLCSRVPWPERAEEMIANGQFMGGANPAVVIEMVRRLRAAETALDAAQARVKEDRDALIVCHRNPATGIVDDELGAVGLAEYNHVLKVIADAMQPSKDHES